MKGPMRIVSLFVVTLVLLLSFTASGLATELKLLMVDWNPDVQDVFNESIIPRFEEENPGYTVSVDWSQWSQLDVKLTTSFAAGIPPDVFQSDPVEFAPKYYIKGQLLDLDNYIQSWDGIDDYYQKPIEIESYFKGHFIALPYLFDNRGLFYRKDMFAEAGLDPEEAPDTWGEVRSAAKKLVRRDPDGKLSRAGFYLNPTGFGGYQNFAPLLWQNGGSILTEDMKKPAFHREEGVEALDFWISLIHEDKVAPPTPIAAMGDLSVYVGGQAAMTFSGYSEIINMRKYKPEHYNDIGIAVLGNKRKAGLFYANTFLISKRSKDPDGAWRLLSFLSRPDNLGEYLTALGGLPPRRSMVESLDWVTPLHRQLIEGVFAASGSNTSPATPTTGEGMVRIAEWVERAVRGQASAEEALQSAAREVQQIMDRYGDW